MDLHAKRSSEIDRLETLIKANPGKSYSHWIKVAMHRKGLGVCRSTAMGYLAALGVDRDDWSVKLE